MVPIISPHSHKEAKVKGRDADDMIDSFMSSWTRLVGDPILSKWIVLLLGVSVALNGYLLKGISTGTGSTRRVQPAQGVRFNAVDRVQEKQHGILSSLPVPVLGIPEARTEDVAVYSAPPVVRPIPVSAVPRAPSVSSLLDSVDQKLKEQQPTFTTSDESDEESSTKETSTHIRSLEECIDIFENGPRPVSVSLSLLNDEEVILLAQNGKIQAYALEKVLGDLERAVLIRRALICMCTYLLLEVS
jgi:hydroxymethylglutaryl-CoA reductase (NADPH)